MVLLSTITGLPFFKQNKQNNANGLSSAATSFRLGASCRSEVAGAAGEAWQHGRERAPGQLLPRASCSPGPARPKPSAPLQSLEEKENARPSTRPTPAGPLSHASPFYSDWLWVRPSVVTWRVIGRGWESGWTLLSLPVALLPRHRLRERGREDKLSAND